LVKSEQLEELLIWFVGVSNRAAREGRLRQVALLRSFAIHR
jgi:hypothetical protein